MYFLKRFHNHYFELKKIGTKHNSLRYTVKPPKTRNDNKLSCNVYPQLPQWCLWYRHLER